MSEMEVPLDDPLEQQHGSPGATQTGTASPAAVDVGVEAPEADAVEQSTDVTEAEPDEQPPLGDEVDEADAVEQSRPVGYGEDDQR